MEESQQTQDKRLSLDRIESKSQKIYQTAQKWGEQELRYQIIAKHRKIDKWIKKIARELRIDQSHERVELIDDKPENKEVWQSYYLFLECLDDFSKRVESAQSTPEFQENKGFIYKLIFMKAQLISNQMYWEFNGNVVKQLVGFDKKILRNIWDRMMV